MNSRMAWSYVRFELAEVKLFRTADFDCSRSGSFRTVFGTCLRLLFAMGAASSCRNEKHDPPGSPVTISAFFATNPEPPTLVSECDFFVQFWRTRKGPNQLADAMRDAE